MWSAEVLRSMPELVKDLHIDFIKSGARIITLNTYSVTPERLERDANVSEFKPLQQLAIELAVEARDAAGVEGVQIAGCLPPLVGSYRPDNSPDEDTMRTHYSRIVDIQAAHVDLFICETMSSVIDAKVAASCALQSDVPVWVALSVEDDSSASLRSGEDLKEAVQMLDELGTHAKLLNCSKPEAITAAWGSLCSGTGPVGAYANGFTSVSALDPGGTVSALTAREDLGPEAYATVAMDWIERGATIVGGCCEVGPDHIRALTNAVKAQGYSVE